MAPPAFPSFSTFIAPATLGAALLALAACKTNSPEGNQLGDCPDGRCLSPALGGQTPAAGGAGGSADFDGGSVGVGGGIGQSGTLTGDVLVVSDAIDWTPLNSYTKALILMAPSSDPLQPATGTFNPPGPYVLQNVQGGDIFVQATPVVDQPMMVLGSNNFVHVVGGPMEGVNLRVVLTDVITGLLTQIPTPTPLDAQAAHAVLFFVDPMGAPVAGVATTNQFYATALYDDGSQYTVEGKTHNRGTVVLLNASPNANPVLAYAALTGAPGQTSLPLQTNVVTFLTVTVAP